MANGKIVVASSVGGIPEIIGGIKNGFLFDPSDINDFVEKLEDAIKIVLNGECQIMRINAQHHINLCICCYIYTCVYVSIAYMYVHIDRCLCQHVFVDIHGIRMYPSYIHFAVMGPQWIS